MKRAKLVISTHSPNTNLMLGKDAKLVDADTGEEMTCISDIDILFPMKGIVVARVDVQISSVEIDDGISK